MLQDQDFRILRNLNNRIEVVGGFTYTHIMIAVGFFLVGMFIFSAVFQGLIAGILVALFIKRIENTKPRDWLFHQLYRFGLIRPKHIPPSSKITKKIIN